ncbi:hypothetical protein B0H19DRAFT_1261868 [Mycena capillaripes]|nr:hypothetical protein B0H19DRAFT_1261868 [Mycena capillaripes]
MPPTSRGGPQEASLGAPGTGGAIVVRRRHSVVVVVRRSGSRSDGTATLSPPLSPPSSVHRLVRPSRLHCDNLSLCSPSLWPKSLPLAPGCRHHRRTTSAPHPRLRLFGAAIEPVKAFTATTTAQGIRPIPRRAHSGTGTRDGSPPTTPDAMQTPPLFSQLLPADENAPARLPRHALPTPTRYVFVPPPCLPAVQIRPRVNAPARCKRTRTRCPAAGFTSIPCAGSPVPPRPLRPPLRDANTSAPALTHSIQTPARRMMQTTANAPRPAADFMLPAAGDISLYNSLYNMFYVSTPVINLYVRVKRPTAILPLAPLEEARQFHE